MGQYDLEHLAQQCNSTPISVTLLNAAIASIFAAEPRELSFLYTLSYIASAGNETTPGSIVRLVSTEAGGQESRVEGGTQLLPIKLAEKIGIKQIALNTPITRIEKSNNGYVIRSTQRTATAKRVIVAMSPPLAARIIYDPILPAQSDQLRQRMPMGALGKAIVIYHTPFWRAHGLNGQTVSDNGVVRATFDSSPANGSFGALLGFILGDQMRQVDANTDNEITAAVVKDFVNYFGPEAANVKSWIVQRWDREEYSRGGPVAFAPPGTETAEYWTGFMDGAIRSGERAAQEVLESL